MKRQYPNIENVIFPKTPTLQDVYGYMRPGQTIKTHFNSDGSIASCEYEFEQEDPPTQEEIETCTKVIFDHYEKTKHHFPRQISYPSIGDQLDALYHAGVFPEEMAAKIRAVKEAFPKHDAASGNL